MRRAHLRYIPLITTIGSLIATMAFGWPAIDTLWTDHVTRAEIANLRGRCDEISDQQPLLVRRVHHVEEQIENRVEQGLTNDSLIGFRDHLVSLIREQGCQVRQVQVSPSTRRAWKGSDDDPFDTAADLTRQREGTSLELASSIVTLRAAGNYQQLQRLCKAVVSAPYLAAPEFISWEPAESDGRQLEVEMRIRFIGFVHPNT